MSAREAAPCRILVARGVSTPEEVLIGDPISADILVTINAKGEATEHKQGLAVDYVEIDPADCTLIECMDRIKAEWERTAPAEKAHLGHAAAGSWLYYWLSGNLEPITQLAYEGRSEDLRAAADDYISSALGLLRGPALKDTP